MHDNAWQWQFMTMTTQDNDNAWQWQWQCRTMTMHDSDNAWQWQCRTMTMQDNDNAGQWQCMPMTMHANDNACQWQCIFSFNNSIAPYEDLKTLHPGVIQTRDTLVWSRTLWPFCHAAIQSGANPFCHFYTCWLNATIKMPLGSYTYVAQHACRHSFV
jgi:hypothetical protein